MLAVNSGTVHHIRDARCSRIVLARFAGRVLSDLKALRAAAMYGEHVVDHVFVVREILAALIVSALDLLRPSFPHSGAQTLSLLAFFFFFFFFFRGRGRGRRG